MKQTNHKPKRKQRGFSIDRTAKPSEKRDSKKVAEIMKRLEGFTLMEIRQIIGRVVPTAEQLTAFSYPKRVAFDRNGYLILPKP